MKSNSGILALLLPLPKYVAFAIFSKVVLVTMMIGITFDMSTTVAGINTVRHIIENIIWVVEGFFFWYVYLYMNKKTYWILNLETVSLLAFIAAFIKLVISAMYGYSEAHNNFWLAMYYVEDVVTWLAMALFFLVYRINRKKTRKRIEASRE